MDPKENEKMFFGVDEVDVVREVKFTEEDDALLKKLVPYYIRDGDNTIRIDSKGRDRPDVCLRGRDAYDKVIGRKEMDGTYTIDGVGRFRPVEFSTLHDYAASALFFPFLSDIYYSIRPEFLKAAEAPMYIGLRCEGGFYSQRDADMHRGVATLLVKIAYDHRDDGWEVVPDKDVTMISE